jgi:Asp-tRNA(Asn)/Glu-tRNA(Gln) amidotransferase A subunit family amidase
LAKAGFQVVQLDDQFRKKWDQAKGDADVVASTGAWKSNQRLQFRLGVTARTQAILRIGQVNYTTVYGGALARQHAWQQTLSDVFTKVDVIALPTLQTTPPELPLLNLRIGILDALVLQIQNTAAVNLAGNPALAMPVPIRDARVPVTSLQLVGPRLGEAELLNVGRLVEEAVKNR